MRVEEGLLLTSSRSPESLDSEICVGRIVHREDAMLAEERSLLEGRSTLRRAELASGRNIARRAMQAAGLVPGPVLAGPDKAPKWPQGMRGSITHSRGLIAAGVSSTLAGLGVDLEQASRLSDKAAMRVLTPEEQAALDPSSDDFSWWATLMFSAKESVYKAVYPIASLYIGYREVTLTLDLDRQTFTARYIGKNVANDSLNAGRGCWWTIEHAGQRSQGSVVLTCFEIGGT